MDAPEHVSLYTEGLKMRRKVVGEDYVENALEKGKSDFLRPLQQFATVGFLILPPSLIPYFSCFYLYLFVASLFSFSLSEPFWFAIHLIPRK
jgi:hypothetical protein